MEAVIRLDTHVVVWLYAGDIDRLSAKAIELIESHQLTMSPMVELELTYLFEVGRLTVPGAVIAADLSDRVGLTLSHTALSGVVHSAAALSWTRDPFDRLIVGDALATNTPLLTKDNLIRTNTSIATW